MDRGEAPFLPQERQGRPERIGRGALGGRGTMSQPSGDD